MQPKIVSREEWLEERRALLAEEKELTRRLDALNKRRQALPWVKVEKDYVFDTPAGERSLAELFDGRSQLIAYHFMFAPEWEAGCLGCTFFADHFDGPNRHLVHHDVTLVAVSRAPLDKLEAYKRRMGWRFPWVSSGRSDFNFDFHASFTEAQLAAGKVFYNFEETDAGGMTDLPGISVFYKDGDGAVFHTYSAYARGDERGLGAYMFLDLTPKGRNETGPAYNMTDWVRRHDEYPGGAHADAAE